MTDITAVPAPTPEPDPSGDRDTQREAALQALRRQPAPSVPAGAAAVLADRILLHTSWDTAHDLLLVLPEQVGGLVLRGAKAAAGIRDLRTCGFDRPLVLDPEGYGHAAVTEDAPFVVDPDGQNALIPLSLDDVLQGQRNCGASIASTPTGYLYAGDSDALRSAVRAAAERRDVVFSAHLRRLVHQRTRRAPHRGAAHPGPWSQGRAPGGGASSTP